MSHAIAPPPTPDEPGYYPNKEWGNQFAYWDGERWSETAPGYEPVTTRQVIRSGLKYHPVKTGFKLFEGGLRLAMLLFWLMILVLFIAAVISTGNGSHP